MTAERQQLQTQLMTVCISHIVKNVDVENTTLDMLHRELYQ